MLALVAGALGAWILYRLIWSFADERRAAVKARELSCREPPRQKHKLPFGIDVVRRMFKADHDKMIPVVLSQRFEEVNAWTYCDALLGGTTFVMTADPRNIQVILAAQFHDFAVGERRRRIFAPLLGQGIFTQDGRDWEHSRAMLRPQFARDQVSDLHLEEKHLQNLMGALPVGPDGWTSETDLQVLFFRLTLDSATEFLFGESVNSQLAEMAANDQAESKPSTPSYRDEAVVARAFDIGQRYLARRGRFQQFYWLVTSAEFRQARRDVDGFVDHAVRLALDKQLGDKSNEKGVGEGERERYVFLDALVAKTQDPIQLRSQLLNILLAGRDTTASHLGWLFYVLARHPDVFEKLRSTVVDTFGTYDDPREITFARLKSCLYLQYCNNETLRLYPVVPINGREAVRDTTLPTGGGRDGTSPIFVRKGQAVNYSVFVMQRRKDLWGPDADEFKPERWIGMKQTWKYLPFNGGPRICLGQQFALTEASYVTVRLLQRFDAIENRETDPVVRHNQSLTDCSGNGVKVRLHEATL
ncbi:MAG: hypothetical protein M1815_004853 [Lichina confinis]|nr:MAG: hypothetical protein M1815_004853 [Lichina confinis]